VLDDADAGAAAENYSQVDDVASSTSASSAEPVTNPSAIYAVVSRNRTVPSQTDTVTVVNSTSSAANDTVADAEVADARRDLYTRVVRRQDGRRPSPSTGQSLTTEHSSASLNADGYARIDEPPAQPTYSSNSVDFYDVIGDDLSVTASSDFDPNYESVPQTTGAAVTSSASTSVNCVADSSGRLRQRDAAAATTSVAMTTTVASDCGSRRQTDAARQRGLLIREHIYDEVSSPTTTCTATITHSRV